MQKLFATILFVLGLVLAGANSPTTAADREQAAQTAAGQWLALVDAAKYPESWDSMATYFKAEVGKRKWASTVAEIRKPSGKVLSRKLKSAEYSKELPGAPEGEYVVLKFDVAFEQKPSAVETVTVLLGQDLLWRVSGYAVK